MDIPATAKRIGSAPDQDADQELRRLLTRILRSCKKSRQEICDAMAARLRKKITPYMLNDWTSKAKKPAKFPAYLVAAFCEVTLNDELQRHLLSNRLRRLLRLGESLADCIDCEKIAAVKRKEVSSRK